MFGETGHAETDRKRLSLGRIEEAARCIDPVFLGGPQYEAETLGGELGLRLVCKVETANPIRSFKGRGTDYLLYRMGGEAGRLVCASAGNFGQGLAYAARKRNVPLRVFAAESASPAKVESMRRFGAEVRLEGEDFDEAKAAARMLAESEGWRFVEDGREAEIAEGAGTIALELCRWPEPLDALVVPLGNGALLSGVGAWMKAHSPSTEVRHGRRRHRRARPRRGGSLRSRRGGGRRPPGGRRDHGGSDAPALLEDGARGRAGRSRRGRRTPRPPRPIRRVAGGDAPVRR